jgi:hypothetical protein
VKGLGNPGFKFSDGLREGKETTALDGFLAMFFGDISKILPQAQF